MLIEFMPSNILERTLQDPRGLAWSTTGCSLVRFVFPLFFFEFRIPRNFSSKVLRLFLSHFFESVYLVIQLSDANDKQRTIVLQTVLVMNMFSSSCSCTWLMKRMHAVERSANEPHTGSHALEYDRVRMHTFDRLFSSASVGSLLFHIFSKSVFLVTRWSDSNDNKRTMVLQTVLVVTIFSSLVPCTRMLT
jgi:hypothetical protein